MRGMQFRPLPAPEQSLFSSLNVCFPALQAMRHLPHASSVRWPDQPFNYLRRTFPELSDAGLHLLNGLLTYDASKRMTPAEALEHDYFKVSRQQLLTPSNFANSQRLHVCHAAGAVLSVSSFSFVIECLFMCCLAPG